MSNIVFSVIIDSETGEVTTAHPSGPLPAPVAFAAHSVLAGRVKGTCLAQVAADSFFKLIGMPSPLDDGMALADRIIGREAANTGEKEPTPTPRSPMSN